MWTVDPRFGDLREMLGVTTLASSLEARNGVIQFQIFQKSRTAGLAFLTGRGCRQIMTRSSCRRDLA
jgi:hypothetical protein